MAHWPNAPCRIFCKNPAVWTVSLPCRKRLRISLRFSATKSGSWPIPVSGFLKSPRALQTDMRIDGNMISIGFTKKTIGSKSWFDILTAHMMWSIIFTSDNFRLYWVYCCTFTLHFFTFLHYIRQTSKVRFEDLASVVCIHHHCGIRYTVYGQNGDKPKRRQVKTATPKRRQTKTATWRQEVNQKRAQFTLIMDARSA